MVKFVERTLVSSLGFVRVNRILDGVIAALVSAVRPIQGIKEVTSRTTYTSGQLASYVVHTSYLHLE
jgi:hypothetical protein